MFNIYPTYHKRFLFFLIIDLIIFAFSSTLSYFIRLGFVLNTYNIHHIFIFFIVFTMTRILFFVLFNIYSITWRFFSLKDAINIFVAFFVAEFISLIIFLIFFRIHYIEFFPRSIFFIEFSYSLFAVIFIRSAKRIFSEYFINSNERNNAIIYGAGDGGEQIIRDLTKGKSIYNPVAIIDDNNEIKNMRIHGIPIEGNLYILENIKKKYNANTIIIAIPSMRRKRLQEVYEYINNLNFESIKILPPVEEILNDTPLVNLIKELDFTDLIGREPISFNSSMGEYLREKSILISGAGGSIGNEILKQVIRFKPKKIIALDIDETELFYIDNFLKENTKCEWLTYLGDIREKDTIDKLFRNQKIDIVFHAAALKHVPICEQFPYEAVKTNILGTYNIAEASYRHDVERFILISTDKAVNPTSIMGGTKRICEYIIRSFEKDKTIFSAVRFGNVLGSRGSVIPLFKKQIERGGPVTVTHPKMKRYFMTIPEAVLLVVEAGGIAEGGEVFILDMGEAVEIKNIAERMIKFYGFTPYKEIDIVFTGIRPGEKLYEELIVDEEGVKQTNFEKILKAIANKNFNKEFQLKCIDDFKHSKDKENIIKNLKNYIKTFTVNK